jgi:hypothetical protein
MPVLSDFIQIVGDGSVNIPVVAGAAEVPVPTNGEPFNTGGREAGSTALLMYSVRNMTGSAQVFVNGDQVGSITPTSGALWTTQMIALAGNRLNNGNNQLVLRNVTDAFNLKDVMCFFHQSS